MTPQLNGFALLLAAGYLTVVLFRRKTSDLLALTAGEKDFLPWLISLVFLYWLWKGRAAGNIVGSIAGLGLLAAFFVVMQSGEVKKFLAALRK